MFYKVYKVQRVHWQTRLQPNAILYTLTLRLRPRPTGVRLPGLAALLPGGARVGRGLLLPAPYHRRLHPAHRRCAPCRFHQDQVPSVL